MEEEEASQICSTCTRGLHRLSSPHAPLLLLLCLLYSPYILGPASLHYGSAIPYSALLTCSATALPDAGEGFSCTCTGGLGAPCLTCTAPLPALATATRYFCHCSSLLLSIPACCHTCLYKPGRGTITGGDIYATHACSMHKYTLYIHTLACLTPWRSHQEHSRLWSLTLSPLWDSLQGSLWSAHSCSLWTPLASPLGGLCLTTDTTLRCHNTPHSHLCT